MNVVSKAGLLDLVEGKSKDVQAEVLAWYKRAKHADWPGFDSVRKEFKDADFVNRLLVFNIRGNRYRLIVCPVFSRRKLYVKALLSHEEYERKDWESRWP